MGRPAGVSGHRDGRSTSPQNALWDERGITLIELMVVVSIIAIIAAIAMAIFQQMTQKAKLSADLDTVASLRSAVALYYGRTNGLFPADMASVNTLIAPTPVYQCTVTPVYDPANGKITYSGTITDCP